MKKRTRKLFALALAILMLLPVFAPVNAQAATSRKAVVQSLKPGTVVGQSYSYATDSNYNSYYTYKYYKIYASKPYKLTFTITSSTTSSPGAMITNSLAYLKWYDNVSTSKPSSYSYEYLSNKEQVNVDAGTYYIRVDNNCKLKFASAAASNGDNYCMAKAFTLASGTNRTIIQTPKYNYARWYKITLSSKKQIAYQTVDANQISMISVYNKTGRRLDVITNGSDNKKCTRDTLPAGTYYICVASFPMYDIFETPIVFKWYAK